MKLDSKTLWNEAGRVGLVFGGFSSLCLVLKEGAAFTGSTFLVQAAAIILWAVEFFGCILLMKKYMLDLRDKFDGVTMVDTYRFGRRVGVLSGLILASVDAFLIMKLPQDTVADVVNELTSSITAQLGSNYAGQVEQVVDRLPLYTFIFQSLSQRVLCHVLLAPCLADVLSDGFLIHKDSPYSDKIQKRFCCVYCSISAPRLQGSRS